MRKHQFGQMFPVIKTETLGMRSEGTRCTKKLECFKVRVERLRGRFRSINSGTSEGSSRCLPVCLPACLLAICRLDPAASLHTPFYIFFYVFSFFPAPSSISHTPGKGIPTWPIAVFVTLPFFKNEWKGERKKGMGHCLHPVLLCIHQTTIRLF